jgi:hypothetical protein
MKLSELLTDELASMTDKAIRAAQKKGGHEGDELQFYDLRRKVRVSGGRVYLELMHPWQDSRFDQFDRTNDWMSPRAEQHPLAEGLALFFSDKNPEVEIARRQFVVAEEQRQIALMSAANMAAYEAQQQEQNRLHDRHVRWNSLGRDTRVATRLKLTNPAATALEFADALAAEPATHSTPPDQWGA